jgi:hypothetical protein
MRDVFGKTILGLVPDAEQSVMELYDEVAQTGRHRRFEAHIATLNL